MYTVVCEMTFGTQMVWKCLKIAKANRANGQRSAVGPCLSVTFLRLLSTYTHIHFQLLVLNGCVVLAFINIYSFEFDF